MSLYTISDLHLAIGTGTDKSMEVFGPKWADYVQRLERNWCAVVKPEDSVVVAGDISWALKLEDAVADLKFIDSLPGTKYLGKGNHDFWWSTVARMNRLLSDNGMTSIRFLYNNAYMIDGKIICGSRGWFTDRALQRTVGDVEYDKIVNRETVRLRLALDEAERLRDGTEKEIVVFLHFPPVYRGLVCSEIVALLHEYGIRRCYYGHIHGSYSMPHTFEYEGIKMIMTAADFLDFAAIRVE